MTIAALALCAACGVDADKASSADKQISCVGDPDCPAELRCGAAGLCERKDVPPVTPTPATPPTTPSTPPSNPPVTPAPPVTPVAVEGVCDDKIDDDANGLTDCADPACAREPVCQLPSGCTGSNCPCDVLAQDCADPADRCWPHGQDPAQGQCYKAGTKKLGEQCTEPPVDVPEACGHGGLICAAFTEDDPGICRALCGVAKPCPATEKCMGLPGHTWGVCLAAPPPPPPPPCNVFTQDCGDPAQMCAPTNQPTANTCVTAGSGGDGAPCSETSQCKAGLGCVSLVSYTPHYVLDFGREGYCRELCAPAAPVPSCSKPSQVCAQMLLPGSGGKRSDIGACH